MFPQSDKRILVTNGKTAYQGTVSHTKNVIVEDGQIKLAPPMLKTLSSDNTGTPSFQLPYDIFRWSSGAFKALTPGSAFSFNLSTVTNVTEEGGFSGSDGVRAIPWKDNNWFINQLSAVYDYTGASVSTTYTSRIANNLDFIELFVSRNTLVGRDADNVNKLLQYDTSYASSTDLTLPANFAITGAAYSSEKMGVATKQRKNEGNAYFFVWDGADTSANAAYPVNDPYILDIAAYKSSWVLLTFSGQLLYFNGGGFETLGTVAGHDLEQALVALSSTTTLVFGKLIDVDGDKIYLNIASLPEISSSKKAYSPFFAGGVYCYDPEHGLYHTASPSYSSYDEVSFTFASNVGTAASAHMLETGDELWSSTDSAIYYAIKLTDTTIKVAETYDDAIAETAATISDGSHAYFFVKRYDYGIEALRIADLGLVKKHTDYTGYLTSGVTPFFMGARVHPNNLTTARVATLQVSVPIMSNRGYFTLGKFQTPNLQDSWQKVAVKYSKLRNGDKIIVKAKTKECEPIVIGDNTLYASTYSGEGALWDSSGTYFTTTADLTDVEEGDEVHIFAGPGAGQSAHIVTINGSRSTGWEVVLDEKIRGIVSGRTSCVSIDKFKKCGVITKDDTEGVKALSVGNPGTSMEVKVELRGIGVKVSEIIPISGPHQLAL